VRKLDVKESGTIDILVEAKKDADVRESIFVKFNRAGLPILMMKPVDLTLEEIFLQVTTQEKDGEAAAENI
jgi:ABC-2 type transport system ATP-binding protein